MSLKCQSHCSSCSVHSDHLSNQSQAHRLTKTGAAHHRHSSSQTQLITDTAHHRHSSSQAQLIKTQFTSVTSHQDWSSSYSFSSLQIQFPKDSSHLVTAHLILSSSQLQVTHRPKYYCHHIAVATHSNPG